MAKPKRAKLKAGGNTLKDNDSLNHAKVVKLNIDGRTKDAVGNRTIHVVVTAFYRVGGFPFKVQVVDQDIAVANGNDDFTLAADIDFTPKYRSIHSFRVLAWDKTAGAQPKALKADVRTHVVRARVK